MNRDFLKQRRSWDLYFLSWLDLLEKLDVMHLELRHMQSTCIYAMRTGGLYQWLRDEEVLMRPKPGETCGKWHEFNREMGALSRQSFLAHAREEAARLIQEIPEPFVNGPNHATDPRKGEVKALIEQRILEGAWGDLERKMYRILQTTQRIKRQVVADRLYAFLEGRYILELGEGVQKRPEALEELRVKEGPWFLILRSGLLARAEGYLSHIEDLQGKMAQLFEAAPPEYPRQRVHRRRDQGFFTHYLSVRALQLREEMNQLLDALGATAGHGPLAPPRVHHRWDHAYSPHQEVFAGDLTGVDLTSRQNVEFVDSAFWMMDKADNMAMQAHELAHHALRQNYDNLLPQTLAQREGDHFARLMRRLISILHGAELLTETEEERLYLMEPVNPKEIAADLLAGATRGAAYLYAFFLELVGQELHYALVDHHGALPHPSINLEMATHPGVSVVRWRREWYLRGRLLIQWLRALSLGFHPPVRGLGGGKSPAGDLEAGLLDGMEEVLERLNDYLEEQTRNPLHKTGRQWKRLGDRLCRALEESDAPAAVRRWLAGSWAEPEKLDSAYPAHNRRLPAETRNFFVQVFNAKKLRWLTTHDLQLSVGQKGDPLRHWYGVEHTRPDQGHDCHSLFQDVYHIPWQAALLRADDFFRWGRETRSPAPSAHPLPTLSELYCEINYNTSLGRRLFFLAMEIRQHFNNTPADRAQTLVRLVQDSIDQFPNHEAVEQECEILKGLLQEERRLRNDPSLTSLDMPALQENRMGQEAAYRRLHALVTRDNSLALFKRALQVVATPLFDRETVALAGLNYCANALFLERTPEGYGKLLKRLYQTPFEMKDSFSQNEPAGPFLGFNLVYRLRTAGEAAKTGGKTVNVMLKHQGLMADHGWNQPALAQGMVCHQDPRGPGGTPPQPASQSQRICQPRKGSKDLQQALLGHYDGMMMRPMEKPLCRCILPARLYDGKNQREEELPPHFLHREMWLDVQLPGQGLVVEKPLDGMKPLAYIYIGLRRRAERLDFIQYLMDLAGEDHYFCANVRVFLAEGWADLVVVVPEEEIRTGERKFPNRLEFLFQLKRFFMQHFLVARTETVLTPGCIPLAAQDPRRYSLRVAVKLRKELGSEGFNDRCFRVLNGLLDGDPLWRGVNLYSHVGIYDLVLASPTMPRHMTYNRILALLGHEEITGHVDNIETHIGWNRREPGGDYRKRQRGTRWSNRVSPAARAASRARSSSSPVGRRFRGGKRSAR